MHSKPTAASPGRNRHGSRALKILALAIAGIVLGLSILAGWLVSSEEGTRTVFSLLSRLPAAVIPITFDGIHGTLVGPLTIDRLVIDNPAQRITIDSLRIDWRPAALLRSRLHVLDLRVHHVHFSSKVVAKVPPMQLPDSLAIPLAVQVDRARIDGGVVSVGALDVMQFGKIGLDLDYDRARYRIRLNELALNVSTPSKDGLSLASTLSGLMTLGDRQPFTLDARVDSETSGTVGQNDVSSVAGLTLGGSLKSIDAKLKWNLNRAQLSGSALLQPFAPLPLVRATLQGDAIDLSALDTSLPKTQIDARINATTAGGTIEIVNRDTGFYDAGKLPVSKLGIVFTQKPGKFDFDNIDIALGAAAPSGKSAGRVVGSGRYADAALSLDLKLEHINLQRLEASLRETSLSGRIGITQIEKKQEINVALTEAIRLIAGSGSASKVVASRLAKTLAVTGHAALTDSNMTVDRLHLTLGDAALDMQGSLSRVEGRAFQLAGKMSRFRLQDLGEFPGVPELLLNGRFDVKGSQAPVLAGDLSFALSDSRLGGQPLRGQGQASLHAERVTIPALLLEAGANRIDVDGMLENKLSTLSFEITAPRLDQFGAAFDGSASVSGTITGTLERARVKALWQADHLKLPGKVQLASTKGTTDIDINRRSGWSIEQGSIDASVRSVATATQSIASLDALFRFSPQPQAPLSVELKASGIDAPGFKSASVDLGIHGSTGNHAMTVAMSDATQRWQLAARGGLAFSGKSLAEAEWKGTIDTIQSDGRWQARLSAPAALQASARRIQLEHLAIEGDGALLRIDQFMRDRNGIATRGRLEHLPVSRLLNLLVPRAPFTSDLILRGDWNMQIADRINGGATIERESGDIVMKGASSAPLGLQNLLLKMTGTDNQVALSFQAEGRQLGHLDLQGRTALQKTASGFSFESDAPINGRLVYDSTSLAWIGPLLSPSLITGGKIQSSVSIAGSIARPKLDGSIEGSRLRVAMTDTGIEFRNGELKADFRDDRLTIRKLDFGEIPNATSGKGIGRLSISGPIDFANGEPGADLRIAANRFSLFDRPDRKLILSGTSTVKLLREKLDIGGMFRADAGDIDIDIGREDKPALSSDVVINTGKSEKLPSSAHVLTLDLGIDLGDGIALKGRGLDAVLVGSVRFTNDATGVGSAPALRAKGTLQVEKGSFSAYGKALAIEQGQIRFDGALNNPALNILAMRRGTEVEAGVTVRGTVLAPRISLVSEPVVPDAEKLSWLVLGRGLETANGSDAGALQSAASSLLSQGAASGVQSQIATAFGLDDVKLGKSDDSLQQRIVTVGKRLSSRLYVGYEQGLQNASSVVHLKYSLTRALTLEVEAGARSALSLFYNIAFD